jgi:hypothetical protein
MSPNPVIHLLVNTGRLGRVRAGGGGLDRGPEDSTGRVDGRQ